MLAQSGQWVAQFGMFNNDITQLAQNVYVHSKISNLSFAYRINSLQDCQKNSSDTFEVIVDSNTVWTQQICESANLNGWITTKVSLNAYPQGYHELSFKITTDASDVSKVFLDNVKFTK